MTSFDRLDAALIDRVFQPLATRLGRLASPRRLGLFALTGCIVVAITELILDWQDHSLTLITVMGALGTAVACLVVYRIVSNDKTKTGTTSRQNPTHKAMRLAIVLLTVTSLIITTSLRRLTEPLDTLLMVAFLYFEACQDTTRRHDQKP